MEHYNFPLHRFAKYLRTWGEAGTVKTGIDRKAGDQGVTCMFMGYAYNHKADCYRMFNPKTKMISETHDKVFLNWMFFKALMDTKGAHREQEQPDLEDTEIESVQQDKRVL